MKCVVLIISLLFGGCSTTTSQLYYDTTKSVSKDATVAQAACWAAVSEIAKGADSTVKIVAVTLAEKCRTESVKVEAPRRNIFGF